MRILHLINHCGFGSGNVHAAVDLACAQLARGDEPIVASGDGQFRPFLAGQGVRHVLVQQRARELRDVPKMVAQVYRLVMEVRPDVMHAHMMMAATVGWLVSRLTGVPLVSTVHNSFDRHSILMGLSDRVVCVSAAVADIMARRGVSRRKLRVVLNGTLNAPRRDYFGVQPVTLLRPNVATLCGLHDRKGVQDLILAFDVLAQSHPEVHLYIAGDGPHRSKYEVLAASLPCADRIHFLGECRDTKTVLAQVDVFVLASHADPLALVIPEAREAGCAIVGTRVDGTPEALEEGAAGILVPVADPPALGQALIGLFSDEHRLAEQKAAARRNIAYWDVARVADDTDKVYAELVQGRTRRLRGPRVSCGGASSGRSAP